MINRERKSKCPVSIAPIAQQPDQVSQASANVPSHASSVKVPPALGSPAGAMLIQQLKGNRALGQMLAVHQFAEAEGRREQSDESIRSAAAEGIRTPSTTLPFLDRIQASFGRHSIGHVKAHVGPEAAKASRVMNALAFASGDHVVFGGTPNLRMAAHEAAHIVQQRAGVRLVGGIGHEGDSYERHADEVASALVAGRSAEELLEPFAAAPKTEALGEPFVAQRSFEAIRVQPTNDAPQANAAMPVQRMVIAAPSLDKIDIIIMADIAFQHTRAGGQALAFADLKAGPQDKYAISRGEWIVICGHGEKGKIEGKGGRIWVDAVRKIKNYNEAGGVFLSACLAAKTSTQGGSFARYFSANLNFNQGVDVISSTGLKVNDFERTSGHYQVTVDPQTTMASELQDESWKKAEANDPSLKSNDPAIEYGYAQKHKVPNIDAALERGQELLKNPRFKEFFKNFVGDLIAAQELAAPAFISQAGQPVNADVVGSPTFTVSGFKTTWGQGLYVVGNVPELGEWNVTKAVKLNYVNDNEWSGKVFFTHSVGSTIEYKYIMRQGGTTTWEREARGNRKYKVPRGFTKVTNIWNT